LKRFDNFQRKIKKFIEYPADLDLTNFSENKNEKYKYRLYAVLVHEGSTISWGHYFCYIKNSNDLWYCMNDSHVSQTTLKNVLSQFPYLLFYERILEKKPEKINIITNHNDISRKNSLDQKLNIYRSSSLNSINNSNVIQKSISNENINLNNLSKTENLPLHKQNSKDIINIINNNTGLREDKKTNEDAMKKDNSIKLNNSGNLITNKCVELIDNEKINKIDEKSKQFIYAKVNENKINNIFNQKNNNILLNPQKSFEIVEMEENNKITISELKYKQNDIKEEVNTIEKDKEVNMVFMGINDIRKELLLKKEEIRTDLKENKKDNKKEDELTLFKSKSSFEMKINLCDRIDNEKLDLKKSFSEIYKPELNLRSRKIPLMSRKFKRLMSIFERFGNTINESFSLNKGKSKEFESFQKIGHLELNEIQNKSDKKERLIRNNNDQVEKDKIKREESLDEEKLQIDDNCDNLENEGPFKKRIFNTKINEIYHGKFIERWEDDEDDDNELNKLRNQADFVRKSDAFKKSKIVRKTKYDMDYDAGKQKKVRIYDEKDSKGKNVFQQKHTNIIRKIKKGIDPYKIFNDSNNFNRKKIDKKFNHRDRNGKFYSNRDDRFNNRNGKFNNYRNDRFNNDRNRKFNNYRNDRFNNNRRDGKFNNNGFKKNNFSPNF